MVGRRWEQRRYPAELMSSGTAGMVLHGLGGVGKTTLADELIARLRESEPGLVVAIVEKGVSADELLDTVLEAFADRLYEPPTPAWETPAVLSGLRRAGDGDLPWPKRLAALRRHVLPLVPALIVLDNFEDNLTAGEPGSPYQPHEDVGRLLADLVAAPGRSRLLITSRYRFTLPDDAEHALAFKPVLPLSHAETLKLAWALPHLDRLDDEALEQLWRAVGGHPRCLEYLDALLARGQARFADVKVRLTANVTKRLQRLGRPRTDIEKYLREYDRLDAAIAEAAALASEDVLIDDLLADLAPLPAVLELLRGASVFRVPVDRNALIIQLGHFDLDAGTAEEWRAAQLAINDILESSGAAASGVLTPAIETALDPHLRVDLLPPVRLDIDLDQALRAGVLSSLLAATADGSAFFMHRWTASELARRLIDADGSTGVIEAHRRAAEYWEWRVQVWPQPPATDAADLREAHYHYGQASLLGDDSVVAEFADASHRLGTRLNELGRRSEALVYSRHAVDAQRILAREDDPVSVQDLGGFLSNLGNRLGNLGRREEALDATLESVAIYRRLVAVDPVLFERNLASALNNFGKNLANVGRREEALAPTAESVAIYRRLAMEKPAFLEPDLATAVAGLGARLTDVGRIEEAFAATVEAVSMWRRLAAANPAAFESNLALVLQNLGSDLADLGRWEESVAALSEAADIYRGLWHEAPEEFASKLRDALTLTELLLDELGRAAEASAVREERDGLPVG